MRKTVSVRFAIVLFVILSIAFYCLYNNVQKEFERVKIKNDNYTSKLNAEENRKEMLTSSKKMLGEKSFIANQARFLYDYMHKNELLIVIQDPEVLYAPPQ